MYIETERLILRRWCKNDAKPFAEINSHTDVMALLGSGTMSVQEACKNIRKFENHFDAYGFGFWAVEKKNDGSLIGLCGLRKALWADHPLSPCTEIAWRQARESWGHGYMTEAAIASLGDGFQRAKINKIFSWTAQINTRSQQLMRRIGMLRAAGLDFDHPQLPSVHPLSRHLVYAISAPEFAVNSAKK